MEFPAVSEELTTAFEDAMIPFEQDQQITVPGRSLGGPRLGETFQQYHERLADIDMAALVRENGPLRLKVSA